MKIIYFDFQKDKKLLDKDIYTIGNFDGVHKGHKKLIKLTSLIAQNLKTSWGVITFIPNTKGFFDPNYRFLNSLDQKLAFLKKLNVPKVIILDFKKIHMLHSSQFIQEYLINSLNVRALVTGNNFKLGTDLFHFNFIKSDKLLDIKYPLDKQHDVIKNYGIKYVKKKSFQDVLVKEFEYTSANFSKIPIYSIDISNIKGKRISSSNIKKLLQSGNVKDCNNLLGYNFTVTSKVIHGHKLGRNLGFPTINLLVPEYVKLKYGIYATRTILSTGEIKDSVSSFGIRPTINNSNKLEILETYIFDYIGDLYDQVVNIEFIDYIREEKKFSSLDDLVKSIQEDVIKAQEILSLNKDNNKYDN